MNENAESLLAFIDILGFSELVRNRNEPKINEVGKFLKQLASLRADFDVERREGGEIRIKPAVSVFSDHIVISYEIGKLGLSVEANTDLGILLFQLQHLTGILAANALKNGLLVRGGVTVGQIYHSGGVVYGMPMIEAHQIESRLAHFPRIVVSDSLLRRLPEITRDVKRHFPTNQGMIQRYEDGLYGVNYFQGIAFPKFIETGDGYGDRLCEWLRRAQSIVEENIIATRNHDNTSGSAKWIWFAKWLRKSLVTMPDGFVPKELVTISETDSLEG